MFHKLRKTNTPYPVYYIYVAHNNHFQRQTDTHTHTHTHKNKLSQKKTFRREREHERYTTAYTTIKKRGRNDGSKKLVLVNRLRNFVNWSLNGLHHDLDSKKSTSHYFFLKWFARYPKKQKNLPFARWLFFFFEFCVCFLFKFFFI